jgi:hypothetical protein
MVKKGDFMRFNPPKWLTDAAVVGLIFAAGVYYNTVDTRLGQIENNLNENVKKIIKLETAISIHHGNNWSEKVESKTLKKVDEIEKTIGDIGTDLGSTLTNVNDIKHCMKAISAWTEQGDKIIKSLRLNKFRALAVYTENATENYKYIFINLQHDKGCNFKKGDRVQIESSLPPARQVEVIVEGYIDDPKSPNILIQLNKRLLNDLGLTTKDGNYELFVQNNPESLRWKSLEDFIKLSKLGEL